MEGHTSLSTSLVSVVFRFALLIDLIKLVPNIFAKLWFGKFEENVCLAHVMYNRLRSLVVIA